MLRALPLVKEYILFKSDQGKNVSNGIVKLELLVNPNEPDIFLSLLFEEFNLLYKNPIFSTLGMVSPVAKSTIFYLELKLLPLHP